MSGYTARDAARLLGLAEREVRSYIRAGLLDAASGTQQDDRLSFQDLVLLRTARDLRLQCVSAAVVRRALRRLRETLPAEKPLTALPMSVRGKRVVVRDGGHAWDAETGQTVFDFDLPTVDKPVEPSTTPFHVPLPEELTAEDWYEIGCELEDQAVDEAQQAYLRAIELEPDHFDSRINLGRLFVIGARLEEAEQQFRAALSRGPHAIAFFNLGVILEERGLGEEACDAYRKAISTDPHCAEAYINLARILRIVAEAEKVMQNARERSSPRDPSPDDR
ncbi:MAG: tetratricopeptide repeat protein [Acidobacteriota bacterium]|nr:tetratricopeptide repeat protein [Acidobacteriota bacterium]MDH3785335.1 tetratricopeptide repeat protein [Acidobacteriota bacterium]